MPIDNIFPTRRRLLGTGGALALTGLLPSLASAQAAWPSKSIRFVVPFAPGGSSEIVARSTAAELTKTLGQSVFVDNKPGAAGNIAMQEVARADDQHTLILGHIGTLAVNPYIFDKLPYDANKDFKPVSLLAKVPSLYVVHPDVPAKNLKEFIAYAKKNPAKLSYGSAGNGAVNHLAAEWFKHEARINAVHVPYKGDSAAVTDLVAGRLDFAFLAGSVALPQVKAGKMRVLASASAVPGRGGAGVPTLGERYKGFAAEPWNGLMGPKGVPEPIVAKLNAAVNEIMARPDVLARLAPMEQYAFTGAPQQFTSHIQSQTERWASVIKSSNIQVE